MLVVIDGSKYCFKTTVLDKCLNFLGNSAQLFVTKKSDTPLITFHESCECIEHIQKETDEMLKLDNNLYFKDKTALCEPIFHEMATNKEFSVLDEHYKQLQQAMEKQLSVSRIFIIYYDGNFNDIKVLLEKQGSQNEYDEEQWNRINNYWKFEEFKSYLRPEFVEHNNIQYIKLNKEDFENPRTSINIANKIIAYIEKEYKC